MGKTTKGKTPEEVATSEKKPPQKEVTPKTAVAPKASEVSTEEYEDKETGTKWGGKRNVPPLKLYKKLHSIQTKVEKMEKDGFNDFSKYNYLTETQVTVKMKRLLDEEKVMFFPNWYVEKTEMIGSQFGVIVRIDYLFVDIESGEFMQGYAQGIGADKGDKGIYKAVTGGIKYVYMKTFNIPTGDDPEDAKNEKEIAKDEANAKVQGEKLAKNKEEFKTLLGDFVKLEQASAEPLDDTSPVAILKKHTGIEVKALSELTPQLMMNAIVKFKRAKLSLNNNQNGNK